MALSLAIMIPLAKIQEFMYEHDDSYVGDAWEGSEDLAPTATHNHAAAISVTLEHRGGHGAAHGAITCPADFHPGRKSEFNRYLHTWFDWAGSNQEKRESTDLSSVYEKKPVPRGDHWQAVEAPHGGGRVGRERDVLCVTGDAAARKALAVIASWAVLCSLSLSRANYLWSLAISSRAVSRHCRLTSELRQPRLLCQHQSWSTRGRSRNM